MMLICSAPAKGVTVETKGNGAGLGDETNHVGDAWVQWRPSHSVTWKTDMLRPIQRNFRPFQRFPPLQGTEI
jgi:hypothetical protein